MGCSKTRVLAKIETRQALLNFASILAEADGVVISRGGGSSGGAAGRTGGKGGGALDRPKRRPYSDWDGVGGQMEWRPSTSLQLWLLWEQGPAWHDGQLRSLLPSFSRLLFALMTALELVTRDAKH